MHFDEVGDIKVGWDPVTKRWRSSHNAAEAIDLTGDSLPPLIIPGFTNAQGQEVVIDPSTGEETVIPKINMPGLGEISITELYAMGQDKLRDYVMELMLGADGLYGPDGSYQELSNYIKSGRDNHFALPVIIYEHAVEVTKGSNSIYNTINHGNGSEIQIPEAGIYFNGTPTNSVLIPIFDEASGQVIGWSNIQQGTTIATYSFIFSPGENPTAHQIKQRTGTFGTPFFGGDAHHSFGILVSGQTTQVTYQNQGAEPLLENGVGIGSEIEIQHILETGSITELIQLLMKLRLLVLYPDEIIYQN